MAPAGPARALPVRRPDATPSPAPASGVYRCGESPAALTNAFGPPASLPATSPGRGAAPRLELGTLAARRLPAAPTARSLGVRPIVARSPMIEVEELDGRDAAYVALLELAIADDEWEQDELTQAYSPARDKRAKGREAGDDRLDEMLDELAAVAISEDWEDDPITRRYALPLPPAGAPAPRPFAPVRGVVTSSAVTPPDATHVAARRATAWRPAAQLPDSWRAWR